ncbi:carbohydrate ABC transporter permease, partial [Streptomyces sp. DT225]
LLDQRAEPAPRTETRLQRALRIEPRPVWEEEPTKAGLAFKGFGLVAICAVIIIPIWVVLVTSLSDTKTINDAGGLVVWPKHITFVAYKELLSGGAVTRAAAVSVGLTVVGTAVSMVVSILCAYGL